MRRVRARLALLVGGLPLASALLIGACLGDDPVLSGEDANEIDGATPAHGEDASIAELAFEVSISRLVPRDSSVVQISVKLAEPSSEPVTLQVVNPPVGISSNPRTVPPSVVEDRIEIRADMTAVPGAIELRIVGTRPSGESVTRLLQAIVLGPPGSLDPTMGDGGIAVGATPSVTTRAAALYPPDMLVVGGGASEFALGRYRLSDGSLDPAFNGGQLLTTSIGEASSIAAIAVQPDGKIVALGLSRIEAGPYVMALARYDAAGALDTTFGGQGIGHTTFSFGDATTSETPEAMALQGDGKIVIAGNVLVGGTRCIAIARRNTDGTPDTTFGSNGVVTTSYGSSVAGAHDIRLFGTPATTRIGVLASDGPENAEDFRLVNVFADGGPGADVGSVDFGARDIAAALHEAPSGGTFVVGTVATPNGARIGLARLSSAGKLDTSFGDAGLRMHGIHLNDNAASMAVQADGKILIGGRGIVSGGSGPEVVRLLASADVDPTFGTDGYALVPNQPAASEIIAVFPQADGRIVAVLSGKEFRFMRMFP